MEKGIGSEGSTEPGAGRLETAFEALKDAAANGLDWSQHRELGKAVIDGAAELGRTIGREVGVEAAQGAGIGR